MRPEVIELFERRVARRARQVQRDHDVVFRGLRLQEQAGRRGPFIERTDASILVRLERRVIESPAELQRGMPRFDFFIHERGGRALIDRGCQRLVAERLEGASHEPSADAADQRSRAPVRQQHFAFRRVVVEGRRHIVALELGVLVVPDAERGAIRLQPAVQALPAGAGADRMAPGCQLDLAFDDGNPVLRIVVTVTDADVLLFADSRHADLCQRRPRLRVLHFAFRRVVVVRSIAGAPDVHDVLTIADPHVAGETLGAPVAAEVDGEIAGCALDPLRRDGVGDHVDQAAVALAPYATSPARAPLRSAAPPRDCSAPSDRRTGSTDRPCAGRLRAPRCDRRPCRE